MSYITNGLGAGATISTFVLSGLNPAEAIHDTTQLSWTASYSPAYEQNVSGYFTGEDKRPVITIMRPGLTATQNIVGWSLSYMVKRRRTQSDSDALITKTTTSGIELTDAASGVCTVTIEDSDLVDIAANETYYHELKRVQAGYETVLMYGTFILKQAVHE